jgi:hypothetical protein
MGSGSRYWVLRSLGRLSKFSSERVVEGGSSVTRAFKQVQLRESGRGDPSEDWGESNRGVYSMSISLCGVHCAGLG